jgi:hypothetical protein
MKRHDANLINLCEGLTLTSGSLEAEGSCNGIPMDTIPVTSNMISAIITHPLPGATIHANTTFNVCLQASHLAAGYFVNPNVGFYTTPQTSIIMGTY